MISHDYKIGKNLIKEIKNCFICLLQFSWLFPYEQLKFYVSAAFQCHIYHNSIEGQISIHVSACVYLCIRAKPPEQESTASHVLSGDRSHQYIGRKNTKGLASLQQSMSHRKTFTPNFIRYTQVTGPERLWWHRLTVIVKCMRSVFPPNFCCLLNMMWWHEHLILGIIYARLKQQYLFCLSSIFSAKILKDNIQ